MAGRIRDDDVAAVRERTDIVKLVSGYLTLKKAGHDRFIGLCPFHTEKTPSFGVSPSKGLYHCFGCGKGGDAIGFLRDVEHLEFSEAVERLARDVGITLRYEGDTPAERRVASKRQAMVRANEAAFELYHRTLLEAKEGEEARAYLESRGIDRDVAAEFEVGYAPAYSDFLLKRLVKSLSADVERTFCKVCGANLTWQMHSHSERIAVTLGTFDTPYEGKVTHDLHIDSKPGWLP